MIDASSPAMRRLMEIDPEVGGQYVTAITKMNEGQRKQAKRRNAIVARLLLTVENAPKEQRPMVYAQVLRKARQQRVPIEAAPPRYPDYVHTKFRASSLRCRRNLFHPDLAEHLPNLPLSPTEGRGVTFQEPDEVLPQDSRRVLILAQAPKYGVQIPS